MHHTFIDRYSSLESPVHRFDVRLKIVVAVTALLCILSLPTSAGIPLATFALCIAVACGASHLPVIHLLKRLGLALPFIVLIAVGTMMAGDDQQPWMRFLFIVAKATLAIMVLTLLTSTTHFPALLKGFSWFGVPSIISSLLAFLYRYIFILIDESERLSTGRRSRQLTKKRWLEWRGRAQSIGTLFVRSMERSERVYGAMLARGFDGTIRVRKPYATPSSRELVATVAIVLTLILIRTSTAIMSLGEQYL